MPHPSQSLEDLLAIPSVSDRIHAVAIDLQQKVDRYRDIDPFDLADALGVPTPENRGDWVNYFTSKILSVEEMDQLGGPPSETIRSLLDFVSTERRRELEAKADELDGLENPRFDFLTAEERKILERQLAKTRLEVMSSCGIGGIMRYCLPSRVGDLVFEGDVEDDGVCIFLRSPYDFRDGQCVNLDHCVFTEL